MNRVFYTVPVPQPEKITGKLLAWAEAFREVVWLCSNHYPNGYGEFDAILAVDAATDLKTDAVSTFSDLDAYRKAIGDWVFGYLTYDVKNALEALHSQNIDGLGFPEVYFIQPRKIFFLKKNRLTAAYLPEVAPEMEKDLRHIFETPVSTPALAPAGTGAQAPLRLRTRFSEEAYTAAVEELLALIGRGEVYEANLCQEFYAENASINCLAVYQRLNALSQAPFSAYLKLGACQAACASPERYLRKTGNFVVSQPIKGTAKRSAEPAEDARLREALQNSPKERAENIMIVDLVRNDLAKIAEKGSVQVAELCRVYPFKTLHQMISTITCSVAPGVDPLDIIKATFPMGSMTGAPKIAAMQQLERIEKTKRGLYSGAIGYISPQGDFDWNVVIRSILYHADRKYVSYSVGSAITAQSVPRNEYEECLAKAAALQQALEGGASS